MKYTKNDSTGIIYFEAGDRVPGELYLYKRIEREQKQLLGLSTLRPGIGYLGSYSYTKKNTKQ